jgi:hypothetical protein
MSKAGQAFEQAVYAFVGTLDPQAEVLFDHAVPDRDTGTLRQCDVWINGRIAGHWPISILVSCKDDRGSNRKLDIGAITTFLGEVHSTGATMGVIYSNVGFTAPALKKATANRIACCRLYQNEPADIPSLVWVDQFVCVLRLHHPKAEVDGHVLRTLTWSDLLNTTGNINGRPTTVLDALASLFADSEKSAMEAYVNQGGFHTSICPPGWKMQVGFSTSGVDGVVHLTLEVGWACYRARQEAVLVNGSYSISNEAFRGEQYGPSIDTQADDPGPGWEIFSGQSPSPSANVMAICLLGPDIRVGLPQVIGAQNALVP